ncbi:30S ribosomal protein S19 [Candidatus Woesearchaeota archaeon]|nr:MAG: 30S ribosomal protein S19 [Candidatus Woesearchaeota archaeon]
MAKKEFIFNGKSIEELKELSDKEFAELIPSRERRTILRGYTEEQKRFIEKIDAGKNHIKTHCRDIVILPKMVGKTIKIHTGREFIDLLVQDEMIGHRLGEYALTRKRVGHSAPGVGATKSSAHVSVR